MHTQTHIMHHVHSILVLCVRFLVLVNLVSKLIWFYQERKEPSEEIIALIKKGKSRVKRLLQNINQERKWSTTKCRSRRKERDY
jgi:hypothetical protein